MVAEGKLVLLVKEEHEGKRHSDVCRSDKFYLYISPGLVYIYYIKECKNLRDLLIILHQPLTYYEKRFILLNTFYKNEIVKFYSLYMFSIKNEYNHKLILIINHYIVYILYTIFRLVQYHGNTTVSITLSKYRLSHHFFCAINLPTPLY